MSWLTQPVNTGKPQPVTADVPEKIERPLIRWVVLLIMLPGQLLFWGVIIYNLSIANTQALLGISIYVIIANILSTKSKNDSWWETAEYWSTDLFSKILFFPGKVIGVSFIFLYSLLRYNL